MWVCCHKICQFNRPKKVHVFIYTVVSHNADSFACLKEGESLTNLFIESSLSDHWLIKMWSAFLAISTLSGVTSPRTRIAIPGPGKGCLMTRSWAIPSSLPSSPTSFLNSSCCGYQLKVMSFGHSFRYTYNTVVSFDGQARDNNIAFCGTCKLSRPINIRIVDA